MHDNLRLEQRGLPAVFVLSDDLRQAAEAQMQALGFEAARVFVPAPIQDRSDAEIVALADLVLPDILAQICRQ